MGLVWGPSPAPRAVVGGGSWARASPPPNAKAVTQAKIVLVVAYESDCLPRNCPGQER